MYVKAFNPDEWNEKLVKFIGPGAYAMVEGEKREGKYDPEKHAKRLEVIIEKWDEIMAVVDKLPKYEEAQNRDERYEDLWLYSHIHQVTVH